MPESGNLTPVRVGPEEVDAAGELAKNLKPGNQASQLIKAVGEMYPRGLTAAQQLREDVPRSKALDSDEVEKLARKNFGGAKAVKRVLGARVRGVGRVPDEMVVILLLEGKTGRTWRNFLSYSEFPKSQAAYVDSGEGLSEGASSEKLEAENERLRKEIEALKAKRREDDESGSNFDDLVAGSAKDTIASVGNLDDEQLAGALKAEQAKGDDARKTVVEAIEAEQAARSNAD